MKSMRRVDGNRNVTEAAEAALTSRMRLRDGNRRVGTSRIVWMMLVLLASGACRSAADERLQLPRRGTDINDMIWELSQHLPATVPPGLPFEEFEYVVAEGVVVARHAIETGYSDWSPAKSLFSAWAETRIDVIRGDVLAEGEETVPGQLDVVERYGYLRDSAGYVYEPWWGRTAMRYNKMRVGDHVILVAVRKTDPGPANVFYSPEFWPRFSVVFNVVLRTEGGVTRTCVSAPSERTSDEFMNREGVVSRQHLAREHERVWHCYDVDPDQAFAEVVDFVKGRL